MLRLTCIGEVSIEEREEGRKVGRNHIPIKTKKKKKKKKLKQNPNIPSMKVSVVYG